MRSFPRVLGATVVAVTMAAAGLAYGGDTSTAEHLFRQGLDAMKRTQFKEACDAFAGSNEADPSPGTEINLALCNEKQTKLASAWGWYRTAAGLADQRGQKDRADLARAEAVKLEPKLHRLAVFVKSPAEGLVVTRNGQSVPNASLGTDVPIDPGDYTIEVSAKGKKPWKTVVHIVAAPGLDRLDVPQLEDAPAEVKPIITVGPPSPDYSPPAPVREGSTQRTIGFIAGGAGIVAGVIAVVFEIVCLSEQDTSRSNAADAAKVAPVAGSASFNADVALKKNFEDRSKSHHDAALTDQTIAIATGAGAVVLIGVGVTLLLTAPSSKASGGLSRPLIVPLVGRDDAGLGLVGSF